MDDTKSRSRPFWHRAPKHQHNWLTVAERHQPGAEEWEVSPGRARGAGAIEAMKMQKELLERMAYGLTTVTQRCGGCGQQRSYVVTGDARTSAQSTDCNGA